ncbi:hypothetical protein BC834DRAFT_335934 [Gloeopeniophorella convolvens]|nr:hypothetical protein BC834DRAFT_335934 [Gloeopeniophorella convolvens]
MCFPENNPTYLHGPRGRCPFVYLARYPRAGGPLAPPALARGRTRIPSAATDQNHRAWVREVVFTLFASLSAEASRSARGPAKAARDRAPLVQRGAGRTAGPDGCICLYMALTACGTARHGSSDRAAGDLRGCAPGDGVTTAHASWRGWRPPSGAARC